MARFKSVSDVQGSEINKVIEAVAKNYPFKNLYGASEGDFHYINMEACGELTKGMTTLRDIGLIVDISGSMNSYYKSGAVEKMVTSLVDMVSSYDDDGVDILFFAKGHVYNATVADASQVKKVMQDAMASAGAMGSTMPTESFKVFCKQLKAKGRAGTVLFITDGAMDDGGRELKAFYQDVLHKDFHTRDNFYCYAIEFGH